MADYEIKDNCLIIDNYKKLALQIISRRIVFAWFSLTAISEVSSAMNFDQTKDITAILRVNYITMCKYGCQLLGLLEKN